MKSKEYLGDSVYAEFDGYQLVLTTENGYGATNTIFMDPTVFEALRVYVDNLIAEAKRQVSEAEAIREHEETAFGGLEDTK